MYINGYINYTTVHVVQPEYVYSIYTYITKDRRSLRWY